MNRRAAAGVSVFMIFAVASQVFLLSGLRWGARPGEDTVSRAEQRLAPLREELPARGTVGYRVELAPRNPEPDIERYYAAQYVLCPVVLRPRDEPPLVLDSDDGARVDPSEAP